MSPLTETLKSSVLTCSHLCVTSSVVFKGVTGGRGRGRDLGAGAWSLSSATTSSLSQEVTKESRRKVGLCSVDPGNRGRHVGKNRGR